MSVAVVGLVVTAAAIPANARFIPPNAVATLVSANPVDTTPHAKNGSIRAFAQIGNTIYAGGSFTAIKNAGADAWLSLSYLVAYDQTTGEIKTDFAPILDNAVQALAVSPDGKLIVGGNFATVNGVARRNLVSLDPTTGATVTGFVGRADGGVVRRVAVVGNQLYIAGGFHWVNGTPHSLLARLNATTGAIDATFQIDVSVARAGQELIWSMAVSPDGRTLVATGNFTMANGLARNQVVMVDLSGATPVVADWYTDRFEPPCYDWAFAFYARDVDFSDDGSYFIIAADGGRGDGYCDAISRWETADRGPDVAATWVDFTGTDSVTSMEATNGMVYVAGHFRWLNNANGNDKAGAGAISRYGLGALDPSNGMPMSWNPTRSPGTNLPPDATPWGAIVWELWKGSAGLFVGQDSDGLGSEYHGRMGMFPFAGGRTIPISDAPATVPGFLYLGAGDGALTKQTFNGTTLGAGSNSPQPNLTSAGAAFAVSNKVYWSKADVSAPSGSLLEVSILNKGSVGVPWVGSGFNSWFRAADLTGAFYLSGRMYFTVAGSNSLYFRYLEQDGYILGCTAFAVPTVGFDWRTVRGMTWVGGKLVYGSTDGALRSVNFDPSADGAAADASTAVVVDAGTSGRSWSRPTLFYATS